VTYLRKGLGLGARVRGAIADDTASALATRLRAGEPVTLGRLRVRPAAAFGFCHGVARALDYAYQARAAFPGRRLHLLGEIVHNPQVNARLSELDVRLVAGEGPRRLAGLGPEDVVLVPAFGAPPADVARVRRAGCTVVDTTCGEVLAVWKRATAYARDGLTTLLHGKVGHDECRATCARIRAAGGRHLVVRDLAEADLVAAAIRGRLDPAALLARLPPGAASPDLDPTRDLGALGCVNQTTMRADESLAVAARVEAALRDRYGAAALPARFRGFDTVCSATQERQDALAALLDAGPDLVLVVGGFGSSNTGHLAAIAAARGPAWHVEGPGDLLSARTLRHLPPGGSAPLVAVDWLPAGPAVVGLTAGASTPDAVVGAVLERLGRLVGA